MVKCLLKHLVSLLCSIEVTQKVLFILHSTKTLLELGFKSYVEQ